MQSIPQRHQYRPGQALVRYPEADKASPRIHLAGDRDMFDTNHNTACGVYLETYGNHPAEPRHRSSYEICERCRRIAESGKRPKVTEGLRQYQAAVERSERNWQAKRKQEKEAREKAHEAQLAREASDAAYLELLRGQLAEVGLEAGSLSNVYTDRNDSYGLGSDATVAMVDVNTLARLIKLAKQGA